MPARLPQPIIPHTDHTRIEYSRTPIWRRWLGPRARFFQRLGICVLLLLSAPLLIALGAPQYDVGVPEAGPENTDSELRGPDAHDSSPESDAPESEAVSQECVVIFTTGRSLTGILMDSNEESIVLRINGIDTTYRRARISSIRFLPPIEERYRKFRDAIPEDDMDGRLMLVDWLRDRRAYALAVEELNSILEVEPNHPQAKLLKTWLEEHLKLTESRSDPKGQSSPKSAAPDPNAVPLLDSQQVNLIRVYEIDLNTPPKLVVEDNTIRKLINQIPQEFPSDERERDAILEWSPIEKLKLLFRHKARGLYGEVRVLEDPEAFQNFKQHIGGHTGWLVNGCATTQCHGGAEAGAFRLSSRNPNTPETLYTNFVIVDRFKLQDGTPLINHTEPERSPLIHLGLVRSRSLYPHPDVDVAKQGRDWRPIFRTTNSINFKRTADWIRSLYTPRPDYGFQYPPIEQPQP